MSLIAYDSATPALIPATAQAVLPYSDGKYRWSNTRFPHAAWRYITVFGDPKADIADVEPGCIWPPANVLFWARARLRLGITDLTIYTDRDNYPAVEAAMAGYGWHLFLATLDGSKPTTYNGRPCRAVQFTDRNNAYDMSIVYDQHWLNPPPSPITIRAMALSPKGQTTMGIFEQLKNEVENVFEHHAGEVQAVTDAAGVVAQAAAAAANLPAGVHTIIADLVSRLDAEFGKLAAEHQAALDPTRPASESGSGISMASDPTAESVPSASSSPDASTPPSVPLGTQTTSEPGITWPSP